VFKFAWLDQARIELLSVVALPIAARIQQVQTAICEHHNMVSLTGEALSSDEPLLPQMTEVAGPQIGLLIVVAA
jgi:hypothetical protein